MDYEKSLRAGTVDMMVLKPPEPKTACEEEGADKEYEVPPPAPTM